MSTIRGAGDAPLYDALAEAFARGTAGLLVDDAPPAWPTAEDAAGLVAGGSADEVWPPYPLGGDQDG